MAGLAYEKRQANPAQGPKGQIPFIDDDGRLVGDSAFIRMHIEREYGVDLDQGLTPLERATAFAIELAIDRELAPAVTYFRWMVPETFEKGPALFFNQVPPEQREAFKREMVERVRASFLARGIGRHTETEIAMLAQRSFDALELFIGEKSFLMGEEPCGADAFVFATLAAAMTPFFDTPVRDDAISRPRLVSYVTRMMDRFFPEFEWDAGIGAQKQAA
jgi:glutathione S-transferase